MIASEELAAIVAALRLAQQQSSPVSESRESSSRWRLAARYPELEIDDLRALH
jgi:hypothetical protein